MQSWLLLWGNACAELIINGRGQVMEMWPWRWDRVHVTRKYEGGPLQYQYRLRSGNLSTPVPRENMFHMRGLGIDGIIGMDPIQTHKQNIGLSLAMTEHGARYYGQGAKMGGIIQGPAGMKYSDKAWERIDKSLREKHEGLTNAHRVMILEDGFTWKDSTADSMVNAEWIAGQKLTAQGIARMMKVPPHRVGLTDAPPGAAAEEMSLQYVLYTLGPWCANWQNQIHCDLLSQRESQNVFTSFDFFSLLRANHDATQKYVSALIDRGILNADEVRARFLGLNKQPDGIGQEYYKAVNMAPIGEEGVNSLTAPANVGQVQKVKKKEPPPDGVLPPKQNGHAALHALGVSDNLISALVEFVAEHQRLN
jgi:HK97 family phage portal protein